MTEDEARGWIARRYGDAAAERVERFLRLVVEENGSQNLIAPSTIESIWSRHAVDSAQLGAMGRPGPWIDIGTGGGFPGVIVAILRTDPVMLVEPRRRRATFLANCASSLGLRHVRVVDTKIEAVTDVAATISARAVASVEKLLQIAGHCAKKDTRWLLPRGHLAEDDLIQLNTSGRGVFHVEQSLTDPESSILVIEGASRR